MKAFFIFRDGKLVGSPIGYTTEKGALKSLVGCEDWHKMLRPYDRGIYTVLKIYQKNRLNWDCGNTILQLIHGYSKERYGQERFGHHI